MLIIAPHLPYNLPEVKAWAVARTGSRWEKKVQEHLDGFGVANFLPLVERRRVYGRHIRIRHLPLFPGYVFFDQEGVDRGRLFASRKVAQILEPENPEELRADLENLVLAINLKPDIQSIDYQRTGSLVEVKHGPMKGISGTVVRRGNENVLVISVRFLGASAELEIDEVLLAPVG